MPVGKNSLKRVTNNGYSAVKSEAPDMENSVITDVPEVTTAPKKAAPVSNKKLAAPKKTSDKKPVAKAPAKPEGEIKTPARRGRPLKKAADVIPTAPETAIKVAGVSEGEKSYCNIGEEMPVYLL